MDGRRLLLLQFNNGTGVCACVPTTFEYDEEEKIQFEWYRGGRPLEFDGKVMCSW